MEQGLGTELQDEIPADALDALQMVVTITAIIIALVTPVLSILIGSAIHLLIARIARSPVTFKQLFSMNTYIFLLSGLHAIMNGLAVFLLDDPFASVTSLGSIIPAEGALYGLLTSLDLFSIWSLILTAIGLNIVASFSKKLSWTVSIIFFSVSVIMSMIGAALTPAMI